MKPANAAALLAIGVLLASTAARAADVAPLLSASARETLDVWTLASGGLQAGADMLDKLQVSGTIAFDTLGVQGLSIHAQVFRTDGNSLSAKVGDLQTIDSIDARPVTRLFESWIEQRLGGDDRSIALRAGLLDLNADFDSIQAASLFVNSSQGIGADLARSGRNGPSIYPVSALGARLSWLPSKSWTLRLAAFDGVPGDPNDPKAFASARLGHGDGALIIGQSDYHLSADAKLEAGVWRYTARVPDQLGPGTGHDQGIYASIEGPFPGLPRMSGWVRLGAAAERVQSVADYAGTGVVLQGLFASRPDDRFGASIARAAISPQARKLKTLAAAETDFEATYQMKVHNTLAVQPDVQYVLHPAGESGARSALVFGLRIVLTAGYPVKAPAADASDPTVPPEGPQPGNDPGPKSR